MLNIFFTNSGKDLLEFVNLENLIHKNVLSDDENNFIMKMKEFIINYIFLLTPVGNILNGNI